jgi:hypothetical protein
MTVLQLLRCIGNNQSKVEAADYHRMMLCSVWLLRNTPTCR